MLNEQIRSDQISFHNARQLQLLFITNHAVGFISMRIEIVLSLIGHFVN